MLVRFDDTLHASLPGMPGIFHADAGEFVELPAKVVAYIEEKWPGLVKEDSTRQRRRRRSQRNMLAPWPERET